MNRAELKAAAKTQIRGKIGILFLISFIISLISSGVNVIPVAGSAVCVFVVTPAFALSTIYIYMKVVKGEHPSVGDAFSGFNDFWSSFKVSFLTGLFTMLWSLLLFIPGIIKGLSYSMAMYILAENPGKPALECIEESKQMTKGHKMELFVLELSFLGWALLGVITFGIALIWVIPYMQATYVNAYHKLKNSNNY